MKAPIVAVILGVTVLLSLVAFDRQKLFRRLLFAPMAVLQDKEWDRIIGHGFIHGGILHLVINMLVLWMFGVKVELKFYAAFGKALGSILFIGLYIGGLIAASLPSLFKQATNPHYRAVGASGAIASVLFAFILFEPTATLVIFPIPLPLPSFLVAFLYILYERFMEQRGGDNVAHDAHLWGAAFGAVYTAIALPALVPAFFERVGAYFQSVLS